MMKRIIVLFIAVCIIAIASVAQSAAPATPAPSTTPQAAAPQTTPPVTPPAKVKGKHARNHAALRDVDDPRVKEMITKQHSERKACKTNPSAEGCGEMQARQKAERRALAKELRKEGKI